jgi:hypothetical protein
MLPVVSLLPFSTFRPHLHTWLVRPNLLCCLPACLHQVIVYSEHDKTVHHVDVYTWHPSAFRPSNGKTELSIAHAGVHVSLLSFLATWMGRVFDPFSLPFPQDAVLSFVSGLLTGKSTSSSESILLGPSILPLRLTASSSPFPLLSQRS